MLMVKRYLFGETDAISFRLDFPHEVTQRYKSMIREDPEYAEKIYYYLVENGTDRFDELSDDDFRQLIQKQYDNVMECEYLRLTVSAGLLSGR